jgi:NDP-sugar pyrophosphorylase family protein
MKALILAGGRGTRLAPYTTILPKPLIPIGHKPILEIIMRQLIFYGFKDIHLAVGYLAEIIQAYFQNNTFLTERNVRLIYSREDRPLGTAGAIYTLKGISQPFLVMNGDVLTNMNFSKLFDFHKKNNAVLTIATHKKEIEVNLGVIKINREGNIVDYLEKPRHQYLVSMGIYVYSPRVLEYIEPEKYLDFPDIVLRLIKNKEKVLAYLSEDFWLDIGRPEDYTRAVEEFEKSSEKFYHE